MSLEPCASHSSKAVSCSLKKEEGWNSAEGSLSSVGSCMRHISAAMSHACHMGCWCVGGSLGEREGQGKEGIM